MLEQFTRGILRRKVAWEVGEAMPKTKLIQATQVIRNDAVAEVTVLKLSPEAKRGLGTGGRLIRTGINPTDPIQPEVNATSDTAVVRSGGGAAIRSSSRRVRLHGSNASVRR